VSIEVQRAHIGDQNVLLINFTVIHFRHATPNGHDLRHLAKFGGLEGKFCYLPEISGEKPNVSKSPHPRMENKPVEDILTNRRQLSSAIADRE
jgi:hypothetical protein